MFSRFYQKSSPFCEDSSNHVTLAAEKDSIYHEAVKEQSIKTALKGFGDRGKNGALCSVYKIVFCLESLRQMAAIKRESAPLFIVLNSGHFAVPMNPLWPG